jgi:hypothetical protein
MALTESQVVAVELEKVSPKIPILFERDDTFYSTIEKKNVEVISARDARIPLKLRPGGKFGHFDPEGGDLGLGDSTTFDKGLINVVYLKFAVQWNKKAEWATDDKRKSVLDAVKDLMADAMPEFRAHVDKLCMTNGTGVFGTISNVATNVFTMAATGDGFGARLLRFGDDIRTYSTNLATDRGAATITAIDYAAKTITVNAAPGGTIATDKVVISGVSGANPVSLLGVPYHHNDASSGTWLGFNRANFPEIRANHVNASGSSLALPFARLSINKIGDRVGLDNNFNPTAWMHPCQIQAYEELGQLIQRIDKSPSDEKLNLYYNDNMYMAGAPTRKSFNWDKTRIDFIESSWWGRVEIKPAGFHEVGGRKIFELRGASGGVATSQIMYLTVGMNIFLQNPAIGSYIDQLAIPTGY